MRQELLIVAATLGLYAGVVVSPGPNFALISRLAVSGRGREAAGATLGIAAAATLYAILTMTGLALVLARVGWLANVIQAVGGCYLVYLGSMTWLTAKTVKTPPQVGLAPNDALRGLRMGLIVNLSNPKGIAFFIGLYAVTVPPGTALWAKFVILVGGFLLEIAWYGLVTMMLSTPPARAAYHRFGAWVERATGTMLAAFGLRLIWEKL